MKPGAQSVQPSAQPPAFSNRALLRVPEAAEYLGVSRTLIYMMIRSGEIPVVRMGRSTRVPLSALNDLLVAKGRVQVAMAHYRHTVAAISEWKRTRNP